MTDLRDIYQDRMRSETAAAWSAGYTNVLNVLPTGGGKSVIMRKGIAERARQGLSEIVFAHRTELVTQLSMHIATQGTYHNIVAPRDVITACVAQQREELGRSYVNMDARTCVGAVDTINARASQLVEWGRNFHHWNGDEAHHILRANKWGKCVELFPNAKGQGVTASPRRADRKGLGRHADGVFDHMVLGPTMRELIDMGALSEYDLVCPESSLVVDDDDFTENGDLTPKKGRKASKASQIVGEVVTEWFRFAEGKRTIVFATDVETAGEIAANFVANGVAAASVNGETDRGVRRDAIKRFRNGQLTVLVNVDLFGEGFDVPACEVVVMARPTGSLAVYLQQFGRALRIAPGKLYGRVIDMVSNFKRHGLPDKHHIWSLDAVERTRIKDPNEQELSRCLECTRAFPRASTHCPYCGAEVFKPEKLPAVRTLEQVDGDLVLLDVATLAQMRHAMRLEDPDSVGARVGMVAGSVAAQAAINKQMARFASQKRARETFEQWAGVMRHAGSSDREIHKTFFLTTGSDIMSALGGTREQLDKLAERIEGWYR